MNTLLHDRVLNRAAFPPAGGSPIQRTLCSAPGPTGIPPHGNGLLVLDDIGQVGDRAGEFPAVDRLGCFARVLEGHAEVGATRAGGLGGLEVGGCVTDLEIGAVVSSVWDLRDGSGAEWTGWRYSWIKA